MATRLYLPNTGAASISPALDPAWDNTSDFIDRIVAVTTRINSVMTTKTSASHATGGSTTPTTWAFRQYIYGPLTTQNITGTVKGQILAASSAAGGYKTLVSVRICDGQGNIRGSLVTITGAATNIIEQMGNNSFVTTTLTNRPLFGVSGTPAPIHPVRAVNGDYIVLDIGFAKTNTTASTASYNFGDDSGTDLTDANTTVTTANNPWIEFSQTLTLGTAVEGHRRRRMVII